MQPQGHVQLLMNMLVRGMDPQAAIDAPRFCIRDGAVDAKVGLEPWLPLDSKGNETVETAVSTGGKIGENKGQERAGGERVAEELRSKGHDIVVVRGHGRAEMGRAQVYTLLSWSFGVDVFGRGTSVLVGPGYCLDFLPATQLLFLEAQICFICLIFRRIFFQKWSSLVTVSLGSMPRERRHPKSYRCDDGAFVCAQMVSAPSLIISSQLPILF